MTPLQELLAQRDAVTRTDLMHQLREGLSKNAAASGPGSATHQLLLGYFKLDERASSAGFASAFKKYPDTAQSLLALCNSQRLTALGALMQSVMQGQSRPDGGFKRALNAQAQENGDKPGLVAALRGFAGAAFSSPGHEADMELSLGWGALEDCLLDQVALHATDIDFSWGHTERKKRQQAQTIQAALADRSAAHMLQDFLTDVNPYMLAQPSEYDMEHAGAPTDTTKIELHHMAYTEPLADALARHLASYPAAQQLLAVYQQTPGVALCCTDLHDLWSAGFLMLPPAQWEEARGEMLNWLTAVDFQDDPAGPPAWVRSAIAFGKIPGDASFWMLPIEGPLAGHVLLTNDDVGAETSRYPNFDSVVATLRLFAQDILGGGGYVSYSRADTQHVLYPVGYGYPSMRQK